MDTVLFDSPHIMSTFLGVYLQSYLLVLPVPLDTIRVICSYLYTYVNEVYVSHHFNHKSDDPLFMLNCM